jgi:hypothetical protein
VRRGYQVVAVDAALGRIEDAFAAREREQAPAARAPARGWDSRASWRRRCSIGSRARRAPLPPRRVLRYGYRIDEVDLVADKIARFLETASR